MEKRIKALYIITIIAILLFLGMQFYWLYGRYEFSLKDYERNLADRIVHCVDEYNEIRNQSNASSLDYTKSPDSSEIIMPTFSLSQHYGDTVKTTRKITILTYKYSAYELLGIEPGTPLTPKIKEKTIELAYALKTQPVDSVVYDASGARDENESWAAAKSIQIERKCPFTAEGVDSILNKADIRAQITLSKADSMVWNSTVEYHKSALRPNLTVTVPYTQLEGQTVTIVCAISPLDVLPGMWQTLIISAVISTLLIMCLVLQFTTVLKLSRLDKMRNSFITTMIHELKRPISTLKMCVSGLDNERMMANPEIKKEMLTETRTALDSLSAYFSMLRDITFNDVEQIPLNIQSVNLHDLFDSVSSAIVIPADKSVVVNNGIDRAVEVSVDRSHFYNILNNLVENAVKYSGTFVEISATASESNDSVELHVCDTGNGIASGDLKHIFKRFYRGRSSVAEQPGIGLGLAYVKLLIDAHGGDISVKSKEGEGTCFTIILPQ